MPPAAVVSEEEPDLDHDPAGLGDLVLRHSRRSRSGSWAEPISYDVGPGRPVPALAVESAGHVGAGLALGPVAHGLLDLAAAPGGGPLLVEALVLAAAGQVLGAGVDPGLEVEDHRVLGVADQHRVALDGAELEQPGLDAEPVEPVGEEADRLVVAEVGLAHPALGLAAAHLPAVARSRPR